ncbi:phytanoyl-CoA dioxygenase family protein [Stappia indica]|uniref:phytanoyl-CoA dioxygenase family protein n=1 Tax=Stappia indica TaxID=538381 RepID=UPI001CD36DBA|nr:phytanoyl-CoA dioxygenase family protein [Stappia indica]MCA1298560.1 phytanoyl-CoA dioxygenase family protein [Stappia indica]
MDETVSDALGRLADTGFCVIEGALTPDTIAVLKAEIDAVAARERAEETCWYSHGNQRIFMLANKGKAFLDLIEHPLALALARAVLDPDCLLSSITANIANPGNTSQHLHADQGYIPLPWPRAEVVNFIWVVDPFTERNGATRIIPGSHKCMTPPAPDAETLPLCAPQGALVCMDGRVWHGTGSNLTQDMPRRGIFAYYCRPYIRQQENFTRSLRRELLAELSDTQRRLLGFDIWQGLGAVNGLPTAWMDGRRRVGPTDEDGLFAAAAKDPTR